MRRLPPTRAAALLAATLLATLAATPAAAQKVGSTSMQFLKVMPSARAAAMGEAYSVLAEGAEAVHWNPAGLVRTGRHDVTATYVDWLFDARQGALAYATPLGRLGTLGLQVQYVDFGEFEETSNLPPFINDPDNPGLTGRTFRPFAYLVGASFARSLTDRFAVGLGVKYAYERLYDQPRVEATIRPGVTQEVTTWATGVLFDLGIRYETGFRTLEIGAAVQNFGPDVRYAVEAYPVPLLLRLGVAADVVGREGLLGPAGDHRLRAAVDLFHPNDYAQQLHLGAEYVVADLLALRAGYKLFYDSDGLTLGAGLRVGTAGGARLRVDYSYGAMGADLGHVQRFSLGVSLP